MNVILIPSRLKSLLRSAALLADRAPARDHQIEPRLMATGIVDPMRAVCPSSKIGFCELREEDRTMQAAQERGCEVNTVLYMAMELSNSKRKLGFDNGAASAAIGFAQDANKYR